jgi:MYXO-CTERM domain-containing protein
MALVVHANQGTNMKSSTSLFAFALATSLATFAGTASADQADKDACVGLEEGDACTRGDGEPGFCQWDVSDPVLTCEDDPSASSSSSSSGGGGSSSSSSASGGGGSSSSSSASGGGGSSSSSGSSSCDDDSDDSCEDISDINIGCSSSGNAPGSLWGLVGVAAALAMGRRRGLRA